MALLIVELAARMFIGNQSRVHIGKPLYADMSSASVYKAACQAKANLNPKGARMTETGGILFAYGLALCSCMKGWRSSFRAL